MTDIGGIKPISSDIDLQQSAHAKRMINKIDTSANTTMSVERLKGLAKDFESVFLDTIMKEMDKTVIESEMFNSSGMQQAKGIFRHFFSQELADQGGLGLWKDLYRDFSKHMNLETTKPSIEAEL